MKRVLVLLLTTVLAVSLLSACGSSGGTEAAGSASDEKEKELTKVSVALNYTLGCDHGGLIAAKELGYFADEGIEIDIVPWSAQTRSESLVSAGTVDIAYAASTDDVLLNMAAGRPITALAAVCQTDPTWIGYLADSAIKTPKDLDGTVYGSWGSAKEELLMKALIQSDGGKGEFENVLLGSSAYEAVYNGEVDSALFYSYSDTINAELKDHDLNYFKFSEIDAIPNNYAVVVCANNTFLEGNEDLVKGFLRALKKGYEYQLSDVAGTVQFLYDNGCEGDLDYETQSMENFNALIPNPDGELFKMDIQTWNDRAEFWVERGFLMDGNDDPITEAPDLSGYVTNDYLE